MITGKIPFWKTNRLVSYHSRLEIRHRFEIRDSFSRFLFARFLIPPTESRKAQKSLHSTFQRDKCPPDGLVSVIRFKKRTLQSSLPFLYPQSHCNDHHKLTLYIYYTYTMKSIDTIPSTNVAPAARLRQERQRLQRAAYLHMAAVESASSAVTSASNSNLNLHPNAAMMNIRPIILSRQRRIGGGVDRKKIVALLDEALSISMSLDHDNTTNNTHEAANDSGVSKTNKE